MWFQNDSLFYSLRRRAYEYGRSKTWPKIGQVYWKLFGAKALPIRVAAKTALSVAEAISGTEVPEPSLIYLQRLTDNTGMCQHAKFTIPDREYGYCTDDNARAVIVMTKYYAQYLQPEVLTLFDTYLSFIMHSQNSDGTIRNFMNFDRTWRSNEPENDALGRVLWAFGTVMAQPPIPTYLSIIKDCFDKSVGHIEKKHPRGLAYSILGMSDYLKQFPGASDIKRQLTIAADSLTALYEKNSRPDWQWFEDALIYDNAILPYALFITGMTFGNKKYTTVAEKTCEFLLANTFNGNHFSFIGCNGWYKRGQTKAQFDQQPIEAAGTVMMLRAAYDATGDSRFLTLQRKAFGWFLGENDLHIPLYDFSTKGCNDSLMQGGVNINQGAESTLSFLLSLLAVVESYTEVDKIAEITDVSHGKAGLPQTALKEQQIKKPSSIKSIFTRVKPEKKQVEELA